MHNEHVLIFVLYIRKHLPFKLNFTSKIFQIHDKEYHFLCFYLKVILKMGGENYIISKQDEIVFS